MKPLFPLALLVATALPAHAQNRYDRVAHLRGADHRRALGFQICRAQTFRKHGCDRRKEQRHRHNHAPPAKQRCQELNYRDLV